MHLRNVVLALALSRTSVATPWQDKYGARIQNGEAEKSTTPTVKKWIIEFTKGTDRQKVLDEIAARKDTKIVQVYDSDIFAGVSVESTPEAAEALRAHRSVDNVWKSHKVELPKTFKPQSFSDDATAEKYDLHGMTGVDRLHKEGVFGKGVKVAIVDTGTWYDHPALGGGFGPGFKVASGYDFVGDGLWPSYGEEKQPDADPKDSNGHGTHVAGIVAGKTANWMGVAPEATIMSYKVFSQLGSTDEDTLIEAFLAAHADGADIITASIGGAGGWSQNAWAEVASRIVDAGTLVTIAAGNNGDQGPFFGSNGASGKNVLAVASLEASVWPATPVLTTFNTDSASNTTAVAYLYGMDYFPTTIKDIPVFVFTTDPSDRSVACQPLPPTTPDLSSSMVLIPRSKDCFYSDQLWNLGDVGVKNVMFFNNDEAMENPQAWNWDINFGMIEERSGLAVLSTLAAGGNVTFDFSLEPSKNYVGVRNSAGGVANYFTSLGGTYELEVKPDIAAPGGDIFSSIMPDGYGVMSGTSMACPYVAGVAALWIGKYGGKDVHGPGVAKQLAMRIMSSGAAVKWSDGLTAKDYGFWAPVPQVGTGIIDAYKVLTYDTSLSWAKFALNDTHHFERYHKVEIANGGNTTVEYKFSVQDAGTFDAVYPDMEIPIIMDGPGWEPWIPYKYAPPVFLPQNIKLAPGEKRTVDINFDPPKGLDEKGFPVYSGKILVSGSNGEELSVPYFGVGANVERFMTPVFYENFPQSVSTNDWIPIDQKSSYTFDLSVDYQDFPKVGHRLRFGSNEIRWDIFEAGWQEHNWKYPPVVGENGYIGSATMWSQSGYTWYFDPDWDDANDVIPFPVDESFRSSGGQAVSEMWWFGKLANGTQIAPGKYTMRFAALSPFGNPHNSDNWARLIAPEITVLPPYA